MPIAILLYSACQPTIAGIPYMIFLIVFVLIRSEMFRSYSEKIKSENKQSCLYNLPRSGEVLNINIFVSIFSLTYVVMPMIILQEISVIPIIIMVCYSLTNIGIFRTCYTSSILIGDILFGLVSGVASIMIMITINNTMNSRNQNFLFIRTSNSSGEKCSVAANQNFVCNVYRNGELVSHAPKIPNSEDKN
jgi:hypothetical protein